MKLKITFIIAALFVSLTSLMAQSPNMINYQGVAHNVNGTAIANQNIKVRLKIRQGTAQGTVKYSEVRSLTTDASGLFTIQIGSAGAVSTTGSWASITWETGAKFLQVEMDAAGGSNYTDMGTQQMLSVPYAQYSNMAGALSPSAKIDLTQINGSGATNGQILKFNGTNWIPAAASNSPFTLPYIATDANATSIGITNSNTLGGVALYGKTTSTNANSTGVRGETTVAGSTGVNGKANNATAVGIKGENALGTAIEGITNAASYPAVEGWSTAANGGKGVVGIANNGTSAIGVEGNANAGIGVSGYSNTYRGVSGGSISGTALYGYSTSGYGLEVNGKIKISGGNTTPGAGKVLTSDASGNATWQAPSATQPKVAFKAAKATASIPHNQNTNINWTSELYDLSNNFDIVTKEFTVPVSGVYHFDASFYFHLSSLVYNLSEANITIQSNRNGTISYLSSHDGVIKINTSYSQAISATSVDARLLAGDKVYVQVIQFNGGSLTATQAAATSEAVHYFSGHLVIAD
ncbi:MAG TPA: hypothetical protein PK736_06460 [Bacteroidia bacterium]|nr:hypothetical protein [Bacteroidia bacterium]